MSNLVNGRCFHEWIAEKTKPIRCHLCGKRKATIDRFEEMAARIGKLDVSILAAEKGKEQK